MKKTLAILLVALTLGMLYARPETEADSPSILGRKLSTFSSIIKELQTLYVDTIQGEEQMNRAIDIFLYQLDPYTEYYPHNDQDELLSIATGSYAGIGAAISKRGDNVIISSPYWDSPARQYGLRAGDRIIAVDGDSVRAGTDISHVSSRLRGQAGTTVHVDAIRPFAEDSVISVDIIRREITVNPLPYYGFIGDDIAYIKLESFNESSGRDVKSALQSMMSERMPAGLILDLRDNGGGLVDGAIEIASLFVPKGTEIIRTRGRGGVESHVYRTAAQPIAPDMPLAILVNGNTASSSEIVAGSLQDMDRAVIIGQRTFGKGLVQSTRPLPHGDILKLTTARYYIPSGRLIQALDYSNRNEDGTPGRTPDSLANTFTTRHGRIVRDGGGITPDSVVSQRTYGDFVYELNKQYVFFDFVGRQLVRHPDAPSEDAILADSTLLTEFTDFVKTTNFNYRDPALTALSYLRDNLDNGDYDTVAVSGHIQALEDLLTRELETRIELNKSDITDILDYNLSERYFSPGVSTRRRIPMDSTINLAKTILLNPAEYRRILR